MLWVVLPVDLSPDTSVRSECATSSANIFASITNVNSIERKSTFFLLICRFGRKNAILFTTLPFMLGWILVATAGNVWFFYSARFLWGLGTGLLFTVLPMYIGEISEVNWATLHMLFAPGTSSCANNTYWWIYYLQTSIRGAMGSLMQAFIGVGLVWAYSIGPFTSYTTLWITCACLPIAFVAAFITMPESPYWLLSKERKDDALKAMARFRGKTVVGVQKEVDELQVCRSH